LTVIFDCFNGELFRSTAIRLLIQAVISELSTVIRAIITSRNGDLDPAVLTRFSLENLEKVIFDVGAKTAKNVSSMRQDVRAGRQKSTILTDILLLKGLNMELSVLKTPSSWIL
jgi:2-dehydropantoate 2-reductase